MPPNALIKPVAAFKPPKPPNTVVGPQNVGLPGYRPGDPNPGGGPGHIAAPPGPAYTGAPAAPAAPAAPPAPDFNTLINADPNYINSQADTAAANKLALDALQKQFAQTSQSYQDNANAHGALFSGAAVHAQNYAAQANTDALAQQAAANLRQQHADYAGAWQRILGQLAGGGA